MDFDPKTAPDRNDWYGWLRRTEIGNSSAKWLLAAICMRIDDSLTCFPRRDLLRADTELSARTITRCIASLQTTGHLYVHALRNGNGQTCNLYIPNINGWLDDVETVDEAMDRVMAVYRDRQEVGKLFPDGASLAPDLCVTFPQETTPSHDVQGSTPLAMVATPPSHGVQGPLATVARQEEDPGEVQTKVQSPPLPPDKTPAAGTGSSADQGGDEEAPPKTPYRDQAVSVWRQVLGAQGSARLSNTEKNQLLDRLTRILTDGYTPDQAITRLNGVATADSVFAAASMRLSRIESDSSDSGEQEDPFGSQEAPEGTQPGTPKHCGRCSGGPRSRPDMYRRVMHDDGTHGDKCTDCHPDMVNTTPKENP